MSRFILPRLRQIEAYTPGEQPQDMKYIKLNTNESPFSPSPLLKERINAEALERLNLYSDPTLKGLRKKLANYYDLGMENVTCTNGSDEVLAFVFMAFCSDGVVFPDISYGFYQVFAKTYGLSYQQFPLKEDFTIDYREYLDIGKTIVIANPNAPTGIALPLHEIEEIIKTNPHHLVVIDEAYVDFGGESAIALVPKYDNLLVVRTYSKSRSLAGMRLGFAIGNRAVIADLEKLRYSTNPYNVDSLALLAGEAALDDEQYYKKNMRAVIANREFTKKALTALGFIMTNSKANFLFAKHSDISGRELYQKLKSKGILVRHFEQERIKEYIRITIGTAEQMTRLVTATKEILAKAGRKINA